MRRGAWKAIRPDRDNERLELYNLDSDPGEEHDVAGQHASIAEELAEIMDAAHEPSPDWPMDPAKARLLNTRYGQ